MVRANCASGKEGQKDNTPGNHEIYLYKLEVGASKRYVD